MRQIVERVLTHIRRWLCWCWPFAILAAAPAGAMAAPLSCGEIADCTDRCGGHCPEGVRRLLCLIRCRKRCRSQGCATAQQRFDRLNECILGKCLPACLEGPSARCRRCTDERCADQVRRCRQQSCLRADDKAVVTWAAWFR